MREQLTIPLSSPDLWAKLDADQEIHLCILNTHEMLKSLAEDIKSKTLPPCDCAALLAVSKAGHVAPRVLFELIFSYEHANSSVV